MLKIFIIPFSVRLSVTGEENAKDLIERLELQPQLKELSLQLECLDEEVVSSLNLVGHLATLFGTGHERVACFW
jgi:hypothetical protein